MSGGARRRSFVATGALALLLSVAGGAAAEPRTFAMGFAPTPPVLTRDELLAVIPEIARRGEYTIIQREVPWTRILGGTSMEEVYADEYPGLVDYLRSQGLQLVLLVDPLDGLDRLKEATETVKNGRTLLDPRLQALHEQWVKLLVQRMRPRYVGLASEINTLAAHGNSALYGQIRDMINRLAPEVRRLDPGSKVFVSFQVEDAWGLPPFPRSSIDQFKLVHDFDIDGVGISSYPIFSFPDPAEIPNDYYQRLAVESGKPLIQVEGGWGSAATSMAPDRRATLSNFASMGIVDTGLKPKPAFEVWEEQRKRPLAGP